MTGYHLPRAQYALLGMYAEAKRLGRPMPTLQEAADCMGISKERARQLKVKLCAIGAIEVEAHAWRAVRVL